MDTEDFASFLNWEDASSDAGLTSPSQPSSQEKLNPAPEVPVAESSEPESVAQPPGPPAMDLEADVTVGEHIKPETFIEFYSQLDLHLNIWLAFCVRKEGIDFNVSYCVIGRNAGEDGPPQWAFPELPKPPASYSNTTTSPQESQRKEGNCLD